MEHSGLYYGAVYHIENVPPEQIREDLAAMEAAGMNVVCFEGDGWQSWEPEAGRFALEQLETVLRLCRETALEAVIAVPGWPVPERLKGASDEVAHPVRTGGHMVKGRQPQLARVGHLSQAAPALGLGHQKISAPGASCHVALKIQGRTRIFQTCRVENTAAEVLGTGLNKGIRRAFQRRKSRHGTAALL